MPGTTHQSIDNDMTLHRNLSCSGKNRLLHFWEIQEYFKCPVVGTCLTHSEQQQLLKKCGCAVKRTTVFEMHEILVAGSKSENRLSRRVDRLLQRKFGKQTDEWVALEHSAFIRWFKTMLAHGNSAPVLWAAATHPSLPAAAKREAFGEIHMFMHCCGEERSRMQRKLAKDRNDLEKARRRIKQIALGKRGLKAENDALRKSLGDLRAVHALSEKEIACLRKVSGSPRPPFDLERVEQENQTLRDQSNKLLARTKCQQHQVAALQEENRLLSERLEAQEELNRRITDETRSILAEMVPLNRCNASCPSFDLCQRRILIVGGISRMASLYREMIENSGGVFEHHDGYMKRGARTLERRLKRADVVLCPVSCNSHAACSIVKNLAKKHNKRVHMLPNSSLKSVSQAIWGTIEPRHTVN